LNDCLIDPAACKHSPFCAPHQTLRGIQNLLDEHLNAITLAELIRNQKILDLKRKQKE